MTSAFIRFFLPCAISAVVFSCSGPVPSRITVQDKAVAEALVSQMTLEEKIDLISGENSTFCTPGIPRLGIPSIRTADGPQGIRNDTKSTFYPSGIATAATWNRDAARSVGEGLALDARARGVDVLLGPGVNIYRYPLCGRNFEYFGEDPFLTGELACAYISGLQDNGVVATVKHFACNNQEYNRYGVSSNVDERTVNEIYFPAFRKAVQDAEVGIVMTSYNPVNRVSAAENPWLIKENLRKWGFEGIAMTDWGSCFDTHSWMSSGIDLEMPKASVTKPERVMPLIENGVVPEEAIDEKCRHILQTFSAFGLLGKKEPDGSAPLDSDENDQRAYEVAREAPVLLKNEGGILPLGPSEDGYIALIGPNADVVPCGGGSGMVTPPDGRAITLRAGLEALGEGYRTVYLEVPDPGVLAGARAVIVAVGYNKKTEHEGADRTYQLPEGQDELIYAVLKHNSNAIVVANSGGEFDTSAWLEKTPALILAWYTGQAGGRALADIISGKVSPSGRLPITFWGSLENNPVTRWYDPIPLPRGGEKFQLARMADYGEGVFVGYRGSGHFGKKPLYPFGFGLSYSSFGYSDIAVKRSKGGFDIAFTISNTGECAAADVAQLYVAPVEPSVPRPIRELKGFRKVWLEPGRNERVTLHLDRSDFAHYDVNAHNWVVDKGQYDLEIGSSSEDIRLTMSISISN